VIRFPQRLSRDWSTAPALPARSSFAAGGGVLGIVWIGGRERGGGGRGGFGRGCGCGREIVSKREGLSFAGEGLRDDGIWGWHGTVLEWVDAAWCRKSREGWVVEMTELIGRVSGVE